VGLFLICIKGLYAQGISVKLLASQVDYLPNESLKIGVSIENYSGQPMIFGQHRGWIQFLIQDVKGRPVVRSRNPPPGEIFILKNASSSTRWIDLAPYFNVRQPGIYFVTAKISARHLRQNVQAQPCKIQVVKGLELASGKFGVPGSSQRDVAPEIRVFKLLRKRDSGRLSLYLRLAEENDYVVYNVQRLGPMVQLSPPEYQLDSKGQIHIFFRSGARTYIYCVADAQGQLQKRQTHQTYLGKRPAMRMNNKKVLEIKGGLRVFARSDFPQVVEAPKRKLPTLRD